jgi:hypothetical protein
LPASSTWLLSSVNATACSSGPARCRHSMLPPWQSLCAPRCKQAARSRADAAGKRCVVRTVRARPQLTKRTAGHQVVRRRMPAACLHDTQRPGMQCVDQQAHTHTRRQQQLILDERTVWREAERRHCGLVCPELQHACPCRRVPHVHRGIAAASFTSSKAAAVGRPRHAVQRLVAGARPQLLQLLVAAAVVNDRKAASRVCDLVRRGWVGCCCAGRGPGQRQHLGNLQRAHRHRLRDQRLAINRASGRPPRVCCYRLQLLASTRGLQGLLGPFSLKLRDPTLSQQLPAGQASGWCCCRVMLVGAVVVRSPRIVALPLPTMTVGQCRKCRCNTILACLLSDSVLLPAVAF